MEITCIISSELTLVSFIGHITQYFKVNYSSVHLHATNGGGHSHKNHWAAATPKEMNGNSPIPLDLQHVPRCVDSYVLTENGHSHRQLLSGAFHADTCFLVRGGNCLQTSGSCSLDKRRNPPKTHCYATSIILIVEFFNCTDIERIAG